MDSQTKECQTCVYWKQEGFGLKKIGPLRPCIHPKFIIGYWRESDDPIMDDLQEHQDAVRVEGDEGWGFVTGPTFLCKHWERG